MEGKVGGGKGREHVCGAYLVVECVWSLPGDGGGVSGAAQCLKAPIRLLVPVTTRLPGPPLTGMPARPPPPHPPPGPP